ncbi:hypothetical protein [Ligilactobacillus apodemi]|uniref:Uncharacterized protein n=1 Tax=Ligilactobacillus apodemi DSM 16634 = JCM 16172 TaxID=1423724 RepID=A0A0R1TT72_9LACO|nr:hypothetical protein [Ligilactobacillus apodemi]KRL83428.1 hypothetical protein FC32_GL000680 [Ligilactobacillus apodemi DSM 16634 = JCM 16172]
MATKSTELTPEVEKYADQLVAQYEKLSEQVNALGEATGQLATTSKTPAEIKELNELSQNLNATRQQEYLDQVLEIVKMKSMNSSKQPIVGLSMSPLKPKQLLK